jgi:ubiquinone/menaquinone biosynthesis C-methylase UbiE
MTEHNPVYEKAVTTHRSADFLAKKHGFESVGALADALPSAATVIDVGAGASNFGREVAALRPDIEWVNFDYSYGNPEILDEVTKNAPENVQFVQGDATKLAEIYGKDKFDAVFSFWLLPHMSIDDEGPAKQALRSIYDVAKPGGLISVGPKVGERKLPTFVSSSAVQFNKDDNLSAEDFVEAAYRTTKLPKIGRFTQKLANEVATPYFGTTRYTKKEGRRLMIYEPNSSEYVSALSPRGVRVLGKLSLKALASVTKVR